MADPTSARRRATDWRPVGWVLLGAALVLVLGGLMGRGMGMFGSAWGWGWMMGVMWLWMLAPVLLVVWLVVVLMDRGRVRQRGQE